MDKDTRWILIIFIFVSLVYVGHGMYAIRAPIAHMALSNKTVTVTYNLTEEDLPVIVVELIDVDTNRSLHRNRVSFPFTSGSLVYPCNMFTNQSVLMFLLLDDNDTVVAQSHILRVMAPNIDVVLPTSKLYTLDGQVLVSIFMNLEDGLCPIDQCDLLFIARYRRYNDSKSQQMEVYSKPIDNRESLTVPLNCEYLDTAGFYTFVVATKSGRILGMSAIMEIMWNPKYSVTVQSPTTGISECPDNSNLFICHQAPLCGNSNDKIRVYAQIGSFSETPGPLGSMDYIMEVDTTSTGCDNVIACSNFRHRHITYHGYCFLYVSVTRTGAVHEQAHKCVPNFSSDNATPGGWSEWGKWSSCTASCGTGRHHRTRACENPHPSNGGAPCVGDYVKTETCNITACPTVVLQKDPDEKESNDPCRCGCVLESPSGVIDAYDNNCRSQELTWLIQVENGYRVNMTFKSFDLSSSGRIREYLRIRDGRDSDAPILLFVTGTRLPVPILSNGQSMFMEYRIYRSNSYRHGFLASFNSTKNENVLVTTKKLPVYKNVDHDQFSGSNIMTVGIVACVIVILITVTAVTYTYIKSGVMIECIRNIKPRIKSAEFSIPSEQDKCSPVHRPYKSDLPSDMDDRGNPDGKVSDRSHIYLAKEEDHSNEFPHRLISVESDDCRKDPLGQDQSFTGKINASFDDRFPDGQRNHRYSFTSDGSRSSRLQDVHIKYTVRERPSGYSRQASINSCDSSNTLPSNFQFSAPYINREGNLTPLGFAITRSLSLSHEKNSQRDGDMDDPTQQQRSQSTCGISSMLPETHLISLDKSATPSETQVVVHSVNVESDTRSPTNRVPRRLPVTPRPAFYEFQIEQPEPESPQRAVTPTRQKIPKTRRLSSNKNAVMTINEETFEATNEDRIGEEPISRSESVASAMSVTRESPPGGPVRRLKQKAAKRQRKSTECLSSTESDANGMRLSIYSTSSQDCMFSDEQPSPMRKYDGKGEKHMWRQVFISDESLTKTISENESGSTNSSPTRRRLPETPTNRPNSFNNNKFPSNSQLCGDMIIYQEENELEFDNYMPNLPGSYFEGNFNYPSGDLGSDMDLFEGLEISKV